MAIFAYFPVWLTFVPGCSDIGPNDGGIAVQILAETGGSTKFVAYDQIDKVGGIAALLDRLLDPPSPTNPQP